LKGFDGPTELVSFSEEKRKYLICWH